MGHSTITMTMRYAHLFPRSLAHGGQSSEFGGHCSESERGTWSKTGSNENQRLERGPVRMTHPLKYLQEMLEAPGGFEPPHRSFAERLDPLCQKVTNGE